MKVSSTNPRILVDQNNTPFLLVGDSPHSLIVNLSEGDAAFYLADRGTNGFNSLWVELLCVPYTGGRTNASLLNGTLPFTSTIPGTSSYDLTTPNEAYFAYPNFETSWCLPLRVLPHFAAASIVLTFLPRF